MRGDQEAKCIHGIVGGCGMPCGSGDSADQLAEARRALATLQQERDDAVGLLRMWRDERTFNETGGIEAATDAFLSRIDTKKADKP